MTDRQTLDFFPQIDMTGREPPQSIDKLGPNAVPYRGLLFLAMVWYTEITDLRIL